MRRLVTAMASIMMFGLRTAAQPACAALVKACSVDNPPVDCETMWAVIAHVDLPKLSAPAVHPAPRCASKFDNIDRGNIFADAITAKADPDRLTILAIDVTDALQKKLVSKSPSKFANGWLLAASWRRVGSKRSGPLSR